jgi:hypothetical protein
MAGQWQPRTGDNVVDLRSTGRIHDVDRCGPVVQVKTITQTLVITTDGERYSRSYLKPTSEGRYSSRQLVRADDDRVLCVRGRQVLRDVANMAQNLADLPRKDPADIVGALTAIVTTADKARRNYAALLAGESKGES